MKGNKKYFLTLDDFNNHIKSDSRISNEELSKIKGGVVFENYAYAQSTFCNYARANRDTSGPKS